VLYTHSISIQRCQHGSTKIFRVNVCRQFRNWLSRDPDSWLSFGISKNKDRISADNYFTVPFHISRFLAAERSDFATPNEARRADRPASVTAVALVHMAPNVELTGAADVCSVRLSA